ncbi:hypothetical protein MMC12_005207 [Toensbergia leucococca]|nr:hypothetical protein [Toensbergia leucococca]
MLGVEALVAFGLASNVVQFIDFGTRLCGRIKEYYTAVGGVPRKVQNLVERLSLVLRTLEGISANGIAFEEQEQKIIHSCFSRARELGSLLDKQKSHKTNALACVEVPWKAFKSLNGEERLEESQTSLERLLVLLGLQLQARTAINVDDNAEFVVRQLTDMQLTMQSEFHPDEDICPKIEVLKSQPEPITPTIRSLGLVDRDDSFHTIEDGPRSIRRLRR